MIMCDVLMLHASMYHHLCQWDWHRRFYYIITKRNEKERTRLEIRDGNIRWSFLFRTLTIWICCRPTARWSGVCKLVFCTLMDAFPLVRSNSATRQWSLSAAKCKAVNPSSFFSSTSHWRVWIFDRISSIALKQTTTSTN